MGEFDEFAEALFGQLSVEINEEKEIAKLAVKAKEDLAGKVQFKELEDIAKEVFPIFKEKVEEFLAIRVSDNLELKFPELEELKKLKGDKVFADKVFLVALCIVEYIWNSHILDLIKFFTQRFSQR